MVIRRVCSRFCWAATALYVIYLTRYASLCQKKFALPGKLPGRLNRQLNLYSPGPVHAACEEKTKKRLHKDIQVTIKLA